MVGPGMMKGASPVPPKQQAEAAIEDYVHKHLPDTVGLLQDVLFRFVKESDLLLDNFDAPLASLESYVRRILDSEFLLMELVRETDAVWGRVFGDRPVLRAAGAPAAPGRPV